MINTTRLLRTAALALFLGVAAACFAQAPCPAWSNSGAVGSRSWRYEIQLADPAHQLLHVRLSLEPTSPELKVQLPVWNALYQVRDFAQHINWIRATDAQNRPAPLSQIDKTTWSVPNATSIEYEIAAVESGPFGAELTSKHAFLNLAEILVYPVGAPKEVIWARFTRFPQQWRIATPMNEVAGQTSPTFCTDNYDRLVDSPVEISNYREVDFDSGGAHYRVVIDADPADYDENALCSTLKKIVDAETGWIQDRPFEHYMFIYHFPRGPGRGGMEHAYGAAIEESVEAIESNPLTLAGTSAHEFFHLWNVKRIRPQSLEPIDYTRENYTRALWFSEGVDSTVADMMLVRAGLIGEKEYLERLAAQIRELESRPAHLTQSVEESSLDAWLEKYGYYRSADRSISYYNKGNIDGVLLDLQMREVTNGQKSLRDLFQWMNEHYAKQGKFFDDSKGVEEAADKVTGANFHDFFARYVAGTEEIPYDTFFATVGLKLQKQAVTVADAGFTGSANFGPVPVVISVDPGSAAEKAGLRAGDSILTVNGKEPQSNIDDQMASLFPGDTVKLEVSTRGRKHEVRFKLGSREEFDYKFVDMPNATAAQRARRTAWIRGDSEGSN